MREFTGGSTWSCSSHNDHLFEISGFRKRIVIVEIALHVTVNTWIPIEASPWLLIRYVGFREDSIHG